MPQAGQRTGIVITCTECGKQKYRFPSAAKRLRCSKKCANKFVSRVHGEASARRLVVARRFIKNGSPQQRERNRINGSKATPRFGPANNFWKGGIASLQNRMRHTAKYKAWRKAVYERDKYKCRRCGTGKDLHAHHIKEFSTHPRLRYVVSNGLTFCRTCHSKHHGRPIPNIGKVNKK